MALPCAPPAQLGDQYSRSATSHQNARDALLMLASIVVAATEPDHPKASPRCCRQKTAKAAQIIEVPSLEDAATASQLTHINRNQPTAVGVPALAAGAALTLLTCFVLVVTTFSAEPITALPQSRTSFRFGDWHKLNSIALEQIPRQGGETSRREEQVAWKWRCS